MLELLLLTLTGLLGAHAQSSVTCQGLGSFTTAPPFDRLPLPHCPEQLGNDLNLEYYNRANRNVGQSIRGIDRTTVPSTWDPNKDTVFVVHGWTNDIDTNWLQGFKNAHLDNHDVNVVLVGWGGPYGAGDINYQYSASTTRTIGAHIGEVIDNLIRNGGSTVGRFSLVGHSLGSHVSGHAGRWMRNENGRTLPRVTGMDPAGPEFVSVNDRTIGLWTDSASFVDTINTDNIYGSTPTNTGHANYYPNGGAVQPGCGGAENTCSHGRAIYLYQESLDTGCLFAARQTCSNPANIPGSCSNCVGVCGAMGYPADGYGNNVYYLETNGNSPYCRG